jgi:hypothetical protein
MTLDVQKTQLKYGKQTNWASTNDNYVSLKRFFTHPQPYLQKLVL